MGKQIVWTDQARADLRAIEQPIAIQILKALGGTSSPAKEPPSNSRVSLRR
ncbi:MAG: hypothetical protein ABI972_03985 [Acidobacteriota bacterium]